MTVGVKLIILIIIIIAIIAVLINWSWFESAKEEVASQMDWVNNKTSNEIIDLPLDEKLVKEIFELNLEAAKNCDIELANSLITEESEKIIHSTCANMINERKCHINKKISVRIKEHTAVLYFPPFNYDEGWPFFFAKEDGEWKIDYYKMSYGITMLGGGCDTGWGWRTLEAEEEFCSYFLPNECPGSI